MLWTWWKKPAPPVPEVEVAPDVQVDPVPEVVAKVVEPEAVRPVTKTHAHTKKTRHGS